jgi:hypothetical protein
MRELRHALRGSLCYFQTMHHTVLALLQSPRKKKDAKLTDA